MSPRAARLPYKYTTESATDSAFNRPMWVMRRDALIAKRNPGGVIAAQFSSMAARGMR